MQENNYQLTGKEHPQVINWIRKRGYRYDEDICEVAAREGLLEVLIWLVRDGCSWG